MAPTAGQRGRAAELLRLARAEFGSLRPGERAMLRAAAVGEWAELARYGDEKHILYTLVDGPGGPELARYFDERLTWDSEKETGSAWGCWEVWGEHRRVRAEVVRWVCAHKPAARLVDPFGLNVVGALVEGGLDLDGADVPFRVGLVECALPDGATLRDARTLTIGLHGSCAGSITGDGLRARGAVNLRDGFRARGEVRLLGADIGSNLDCSGGTFDCARREDGAPIGNGCALSADGLRARGDVNLGNGFRARGEVRLLGASIGGDLNGDGGSFDCARDKDGAPAGEGRALSADRLQATGSVNLRSGFRARGGVRLLGADIGGDLDCDGGSFDCARSKEGAPVGEGRSLIADRLRARGGVNLRHGFRARGEVRLPGAEIGGDLDCDGGTFDCARNAQREPVGAGRALNAQGAVVRGSLLLRGAAFVREQAGGTPAPPGGGVLELTRARVGYLHDQATGSDVWPGTIYPPGLVLTDFRYETIHARAPLDARRRLAWLARHDKTAAGFLPEWEREGHFDPQPYRQLASVLRAQGHGREANRVMVAAARAQGRAAYARLRARGGALPARIWWWLVAGWGRLGLVVFGLVVGYGYRRWQPLLWMGGIIMLGWMVFCGVLSEDPSTWMRPTQALAAKDVAAATDRHAPWVDAEYPDFHPLVFSADAFLPLVDFHQESYWTPRTWWVKHVYLPLHIVAGWVVTTLFAVSFTGLVRGQERE